LDDAFSPLIDTIESQAAPVYPLKTHFRDKHPFSWLDGDNTFQDWLGRRGSSIMHIHGNSSASQAAEYGFQKFFSTQEIPGKEIVLYFKFDQHDARRNSVAAMSVTFLAQILGRFRTPPGQYIPTFEPPLFNQCLTSQDAFLLLNSVRIDMASRARTTWILDGLDQCDPTSSHWFLSQLLDIAASSEIYFKVLITTFDDKRIRDTLAKYSEIDLKGNSQVVDAIDSNTAVTNDLYLELLFERPEFQHCQPELEKLLSSCGSDMDLFRIIRDWLLMTRWTTTKRSMKKELEMLSPPSPRKLFERILETVPQPRRPWARKVILWVLRSVRPLSPQELASVLSLDEDQKEPDFNAVLHLDIMSELRYEFGPLFVMENNEIRFNHPSARGFFASGDTSPEDAALWYTLSTPEVDHREIARTCVRYLSLPEALRQILVACCDPRDSGILLDHGCDFQSYAIQYWPYHYHLGYMTNYQTPPPKDITNFLQDPKALRHWSAANWYLSKPHLRANRSFFHPLPIHSYLGLEKEVREAIASLDASEESEKLVADALSEAARKGHKGVVQGLLQMSDISLKGILDAMEAAACSAEFDILSVLLPYATSSHKAASYRWPPVVLCRVAWSGMDRLLKKFFQSKDTTGAQDLPESPSGLYCAITRNHISTAGILLEHGADRDFHDKNRRNRTAMHAAAIFGYAAAIRVLAQARATVDSKDDDERTPLYWATINGQHQAVQALLDAGADKTNVESAMSNTKGWPGLITAAAGSYEICVRLLLEHGVNVNVEGKQSSTALSWAAQSGLVDMCRLLLDNGAEVDGSEQCRPLVEAASKSRNLDSMGLLLDRGADVNAAVRSQSTALMVAVNQNLKDIVIFLIDKGADVNAVVSRSPALFQAAEKGHAEIVRLLMSAGADYIQGNPTFKWAPIHAAYSYPECLRALLDGGADIDAASDDSTALYIATYHGKTESVKLLISRGANLEITCEFPDLSDSNYTPLLAASMKGHSDITRALLEAGANAKIKAPNKETALHLSFKASSEPTLKVLLEYDPDLDAKNDDEKTVLHLVDAETPVSLAKPLVNRGANLEIRDINGYTSLGLAISNGNLKLVKCLIAAKAKINIVSSYWGGPLHIACTGQNLEILKLLLENGADVNLVDPHRGTPLQVACLPAYDSKPAAPQKLIQFLIEEAGADVTVRGGYLGTALHAACLGQTPGMIKTIIERGADVNGADPLGRRPIHFATMRTVDHVAQLLSSGANIQVKDKLGRTLLHTAVTSGRVDVVQMILSLTDRLVNEPDYDGWTPLLWVTRSCNDWDTLSSNQASIIKILIAQGADLWAQGQSWEQEWSALKLARYHGSSGEIISLLTPKEKKKIDKNGQERVWNPQVHRSRKAKFQDGYCDACLYVSTRILNLF
jgi:ankyrin repeat protein